MKSLYPHHQNYQLWKIIIWKSPFQCTTFSAQLRRDLVREKAEKLIMNIPSKN